MTFDRLTESGYFPDGILVFYIVGVVGSEINMIKYAHYNLTQ